LWQADNRAPAGTLAHILETYALSAAISQQHRNKVALQASWIRDAMRRGPHPRVLSIACGSCPDLRSVAEDVHDGAIFVLCDSDANALEFSRAKLGALAEQCRFVQGSVPRVLRRLPRDERYDLIFAGGLFDYLPDRFIIRTLHDAWHDLLAPGGRLAFTNIARGNPFRVWLEYVGSWPLIERSEADLIALCSAAGISVAPEVTHEATGLSIIVSLMKEHTQTRN
jgi:SAM-dependent methyltransferase